MIGWARKYGLRIYLDLHTVPGSQNGTSYLLLLVIYFVCDGVSELIELLHSSIHLWPDLPNESLPLHSVVDTAWRPAIPAYISRPSSLHQPTVRLTMNRNRIQPLRQIRPSQLHERNHGHRQRTANAGVHPRHYGVHLPGRVQGCRSRVRDRQ